MNCVHFRESGKVENKTSKWNNMIYLLFNIIETIYEK